MPVLIIKGASQLMAVAAHLKEASGAPLRGVLRRTMRESLSPLVREIKEGMLSEELPATSSPGGGGQQRLEHALGRRKRAPSEKVLRQLEARSGLRQSIAGGVGISVGLNPEVPYIKIRVGTSALPPDQKGLPRAIEHGKWRHPVFGTDRWVTQHSKPFFYPPIYRELPKIETEVSNIAREFVVRIAGRPVIGKK